MIDCYLKFIYSYFSVAIKITCKSDWISHCPTVPHPQNERIYIHMQLTRSIKVVDGMVIPFLLINLCHPLHGTPFLQKYILRF